MSLLDIHEHKQILQMKCQWVLVLVGKTQPPMCSSLWPLSSLARALLWRLGPWRCCRADSLTPFHFCMTQQNRPQRFLYSATDRRKQMLQTDVIKHRCDLKSPRQALGSSQTVQSTDWQQAENAARGSPFPLAEAGTDRDRYGRYKHAPAAGEHLGAARLQEGPIILQQCLPLPGAGCIVVLGEFGSRWLCQSQVFSLPESTQTAWSSKETASKETLTLSFYLVMSGKGWMSFL